MPIFEYRCSSCGHKFEDIRTQAEADKVGDCPKCGKPKVERVMSAFSCGPGCSSTGPSWGGGSGFGRRSGG